MKPEPATERLPLDPRGRLLPPRLQPGYYPKYSTLSQQAFWDEATRSTVLRRVTIIPPVRFFTPAEAEILQRVVEHVLPQDDCTPERRVPILPFIDERLFSGRTAGYRFEDMPQDGEAYRCFLRAFDLMPLTAHGAQYPRVIGGSEPLTLGANNCGKGVGGWSVHWSAFTPRFHPLDFEVYTRDGLVRTGRSPTRI